MQKLSEDAQETLADALYGRNIAKYSNFIRFLFDVSPKCRPVPHPAIFQKVIPSRVVPGCGGLVWKERERKVSLLSLVNIDLNQCVSRNS